MIERFPFRGRSISGAAFLSDVEGGLYGLIQFLNLAGIARAHQALQTVPWNGKDVV